MRHPLLINIEPDLITASVRPPTTSTKHRRRQTEKLQEDVAAVPRALRTHDRTCWVTCVKCNKYFCKDHVKHLNDGILGTFHGDAQQPIKFRNKLHILQISWFITAVKYITAIHNIAVSIRGNVQHSRWIPWRCVNKTIKIHIDLTWLLKCRRGIKIFNSIIKKREEKTRMIS